MAEATTSETGTGATGGASRLLHTMIRVRDLDRSLDFYTRQLGMRLLRRTDYPGGRFTLAFVGYGDEAATAVVELTHNWDQAEPYVIGTGFGHLAIAVPDIVETCRRLAADGVPVPRPPGPMSHGTTILAFVEDPDGYRIELIERR
jgi:lactoylglutathione lyase